MYNELYTIYDTNQKFTQSTVHKLSNHTRRWGTPIFNNGSRNRLQYTCGLSTQRTIVDVMLKTTTFLNRQYPMHIANNWAVLHSTRNCPRQPAHSDYHPDILDDAHTLPLFAILAIASGTTIDIWLDDHDTAVSVLSTKNPVARRVTIELQEGELFIGRADLIHAGSDYSEPNTRFHVFLDTPEVERPVDRTYLIELDDNFTNLEDCV